MSRKNQMMVAEGISKKNILPRFGTNNSPNLRLEQDMRKFMYERKPAPEKPLTEDAPSGSGGSTLAAANGNNVTGDGTAGSEAATAAGASGVTEPVVRAVGEEAMNLAIRKSTEESIAQAFINDLTEKILYGEAEHGEGKGSPGRQEMAKTIKRARADGKSGITTLDNRASISASLAFQDPQLTDIYSARAAHYGNAAWK